jgi:hypothetical protein
MSNAQRRRELGRETLDTVMILAALDRWERPRAISL